jgi:hypothetical protein
MPSSHSIGSELVKGKVFVVCVLDYNNLTKKHPSEGLQSLDDTQEFLFHNSVLLFSIGELLGEVGDWTTPGPVFLLL